MDLLAVVLGDKPWALSVLLLKGEKLEGQNCILTLSRVPGATRGIAQTTRVESGLNDRNDGVERRHSSKKCDASRFGTLARAKALISPDTVVSHDNCFLSDVSVSDMGLSQPILIASSSDFNVAALHPALPEQRCFTSFSFCLLCQPGFYIRAI